MALRLVQYKQRWGPTPAKGQTRWNWHWQCKNWCPQGSTENIIMDDVWISHCPSNEDS